MAEHTPTPWERTDGDIWIDTREQVCCGRGYDACCGEPDVRGGQELIAQSNPADAAHIVKCVNAYPDLVKALEAVAAAKMPGEARRIAVEALRVDVGGSGT